MVFIGIAALCLTPLISPPIALLLGLFVAQFIGHPYAHLNHKATSRLLQISIVGLGFGMNITTALQAGKTGFLFTVVSIIGTLIIGLVIGNFFKADKKTSFLISSGTAICGGSAIAAIAPVIKAEERQISVALGIIFILNSVALLLFPVIGHLLGLSQSQFGLWCAIAIHDTSSVVGASSKFGPQALEIATTVKLARALWIIPLALSATFFFRTKGSKIKIPYFIGLFVLAICINTYFPFPAQVSDVIRYLAKAGLTLTIFLIGCGLTKKVLQSVGLKYFLQGFILWVIISVSALLVIMNL